MSSQRHVVRRFDPVRAPDFDEQFWPVAMATCILAALTVGSILTILRGPWMWGSLLAIPILVGLVLLALSYVEQRFWRRSIQVALLLSLAFHLLVLIVAYRTEIFGRKNPLPMAVDRPLSPIPQLEISTVQPEAIWNQPNPIETPQTDVTVERRENTEVTEAPNAEPVAIADAQANPNPRLDRTEATTETTPKMGESLSRRSRNVDHATPESRELTIASSAQTQPAARSEPSENSLPDQVPLERQTETDADAKPIARRQLDPDTSERARTRDPRRREETPAQPPVASARNARRTSQIEPDATTAPQLPPRPTRAETPSDSRRRELPAADMAAVRRDVAPTLTRSTEESSATSQTDRQPQRSDRTQIADAMSAPQSARRSQRQRQSRAPTESSVAATDAPSAPRVERVVQPSPQATEISRQEIEDEQWVAQARPAERSELTPTDQAPRIVRRRANSSERPSDLPASGAVARLARDPAPEPTTAESLESPAVPAASGQPNPANTEAKSFALERSTAGVSGLGATPNFGRATESLASPAQSPSDSARRENAESQFNTAQTLSPSQATSVSRAAVGLDSPQVSLPDATSAAADRAAGAEPQPISASSAAAVTAARAAGQRSEISADAGGSDLDLGSTKIVSGTARRDSAGGGQPEISPVHPAAVRVAARNGSSQASIVADTAAETVAAPVTEGSAQPANRRSSPNAAAAIEQKRGGSNPLAQGPSRGEISGDPAESSSAAIRDRQTASRSSPRSSRGSEGDDAADDPNPTNTRRAIAARQTAVDGPETEGQPTGIAVQSTAAETGDDSEAADSRVERTDRAASAAISPSTSQADDAVAGSSRIASNSAQRRAEDSSETGETSQMLSKVTGRVVPSVSVEINSGTEGTEFARGMSSQADSNRDESDPRAVEPERASGHGLASLGPNARRDDVTSADTSRLVDGSGRAEAGSTGVADADPSASKRLRNDRPALDADATAALEGPAATGIGASASPNQMNDRVASARRNESYQAHVDIDADEGAGGLGSNAQPEIGVASRRASSSSDVVAVEPNSRFHRRDASGELAVSPAVNLAKAPFRGRNPGNLGNSGPQTERAIELGLAFLIRNQHADGHWSLLGFDDGHASKQLQLDSDTAATGLALLAFQGAGYTHREFKYADRLKRAVAWLVSHQAADGNLYVSSDKLSNASCQLYSHAIATLALAEAYGMTQDPDIRPAAQKAIEFIVKTQDPRHGGWRYQTAVAERSTDTSVTGWMVMALHSGRLAGLDVDPNVWTGVADWLQTAQAAESESQFVYSPFVQDDPNRRIVRSHLRRASNCMTAIGLLMEIYTSSEQNNRRMEEAAGVLLKQLPSEFSLEVRDTYYWYYATQVLRHVGGPNWQAWNSVLHPLLISTQVADGELAGSWHPYTPVEDKFGRFGGRLYVTALNLLSLEVDYRLLPLYENTTTPKQ